MDDNRRVVYQNHAPAVKGVLPLLRKADDFVVAGRLGGIARGVRGKRDLPALLDDRHLAAARAVGRESIYLAGLRVLKHNRHLRRAPAHEVRETAPLEKHLLRAVSIDRTLVLNVRDMRQQKAL